MLMPAFHDWPDEAAIIARLLAGYGELEFLLAISAGTALTDVRKGMRLLFHRRGETARIDLAQLLTNDAMTRAGLAAEYEETVKAMRACMRIRNVLAHCHWASLKRSQPSAGLYFVSMEKAVRAEEKVEYEWQAATLHRLQEFERYFEYTSACFMHVDQELWDKNGGPQSRAFPMPEHRNAPLERVPASPAAVALLPKEF